MNDTSFYLFPKNNSSKESYWYNFTPLKDKICLFKEGGSGENSLFGTKSVVSPEVNLVF